MPFIRDYFSSPKFGTPLQNDATTISPPSPAMTIRRDSGYEGPEFVNFQQNMHESADWQLAIQDCFSETESLCSWNSTESFSKSFSKSSYQRSLLELPKHMPFPECSCIAQRDSENEYYHQLRFSESLHKARLNSLAPGTAAWPFESESFRKWLEADTSSMLWIHGSPGTGKSMLISSITKTLQSSIRSEDSLFYFFYNRRCRSSNLTSWILRSILRQLGSRSVDQKYQRRLQALTSRLEDAGDDLSVSQMKDLFNTMRHRLNRYDTLYLILDGTDEIQRRPDSYISALLDIIVNEDNAHKIKCIVSSRSDYLAHKQSSKLLRICIDATAAVKQDVAAYIRYEVFEKLKLYRSDDNLIEEIIEQLASRANGNFLWARLQIENIASALPFKHCSAKALRQLLGSSLKPDICAIYESRIRTIPRKDHQSAAQLLRWAVYSQRPLLLAELGYIIHDAELTESRLKEICGSLLVVEESQCVELKHFTAAEFLMSKFEEPESWILHSGDPQEAIARECLMVLPSSHLLESLGIPTKLAEKELLTQSHSLVAYASQYWKDHYTLAECRSKSLPGLLHRSLKTALEQYCPNISSILDSEDEDVEMSDLLTFSGRINAETSNIVLSTAARFGFASLARLELEMGADWNAKTRNCEENALHLAARMGHFEIVELLLQYGADPCVASTQGITPMDYAAYRGHYNLLELFSLSTKHSQTFHQTIKFEPRAAEVCDICGETETSYLMLTCQERPEKGSAAGTICILGNTILGDELDFFEYQSMEDSGIFTNGNSRLEYQDIYWPSCVDMNVALQAAAKRGIEDVRRLICVFGNDPSMIDEVTSLCPRFCEIAVS